MDKIMKYKKKIIIGMTVLITCVISLAVVFVYLENKNINANTTMTNEEKIQKAKEKLIAEGYTENDYFTKVTEDIPLTKSQLTSYGKTDYNIDSVNDWLALMILSTECDLNGYHFKIQQNFASNSNTSYDLTAVDCFAGIATNSQYPFRGTLTSIYEGIQIVTNVPLFGYLNLSATVGGGGSSAFSLNVSGSAGLAGVLTGSGTLNSNSYQNITLSGSVSGNENAGGLFGKIVNETDNALILSTSAISVNNQVTEVKGLCSGGIAGVVEGNVELVLDTPQANSNMYGMTVKGIYSDSNPVDSYAGGIAGKIIASTKDAQTSYTPKVTVNQQIEIKASMGSATYAGGVAGYMENIIIQSTVANAGINQTADLSVKGYVGGVAGFMKDVTLTHSYDFSIKANITGARYAGGLCGFGENINLGSSANAKIISNDSSINAGSYVGSPCIGGLIGYYRQTYTTENGFEHIEINKLMISAGGYWGSESKPTLSMGGIVGIMDADGVNFSSVSVKNIRVPLYNNNYQNSYFGGVVGKNLKENLSIQNAQIRIYEYNSGWWSEFYASTFGGVIGYSDKNCMINSVEIIGTAGQNINQISTLQFGGVVGVIENSSDDKPVILKVSNVNYQDVSYNFLAVNPSKENTIVGGIVGEMIGKTVLCLDRSIDLSKVTKSSQLSSLAEYSYYGYIVGKQSDSSLVYINPISCTTSGYVYGLHLPETQYADEIGNYGGVYRNGNWDIASYSEISSEAIADDKTNWLIQETEEDGIKNIHIKNGCSFNQNKYIIDTVGDIMRLAIACNSSGAFGLEGFTGNAVTYEGLLNADYVLQGNIDIRNTGIRTINKNVLITNHNIAHAFTGSLDGGNHTITYQSDSYHQANIGLFSVVKDASFSNLIVSGSACILDNSDAGKSKAANREQQNVGGLAAYGYGTIDIQNVTTNVKISDGGQNSGTEYYGSLFGYYKAASSNCLHLDKIESQVNMDYHSVSHIAGGLIGYVDIADVAADTPASLSAGAITLKGQISVQKSEKGDYQLGGMIAGIGAETTISANNSCLKKYVVTAADIKLQDFAIKTVSDVSLNDAEQLGGLMGYQWQQVEADITNLCIEAANGNTNTSGILLTGSKLTYGGLWHTVTGKMNLPHVEIKNTKFWVNSSADQNGLLVRNGQYLYLELGTYTLTGTTVSNSATYFDEIVGFNQGTNEKFDENTGGIASITMNSKPDYQLYKNQIVAQANPHTRYYYNLATDMAGVLQTKLNGTSITIDSTGKFLQWHLAHYANTPLKKYFGVEDYSTNRETVTFRTNLDLTDISYYPTENVNGTYQGGNYAITFHGNDFDTKNSYDDQLLYSYKPSSQHYKLQSGVFGTVHQGVSISNIILQGSVTSYLRNNIGCSGGLITGSILGGAYVTDENGFKTFSSTPVSITNITLQNFSVSNKQNTENTQTIPYSASGWNSYYGLMVYDIAEGAVVNFDTIAMIGYTTSDHVAAALIGKVGEAVDENEKTPQGMKLSFTNMDIADVKDNLLDTSTSNSEGEVNDVEDIHSTAGDKALAYASFIYYYNYYENTSNGVYIFYFDDYVYGKNIKTGSVPENSLGTGMVTLGEEIGTTVQFYDEDKNKPIVEYLQSYTWDEADRAFPFDAANYKPYVYQVKKIDVNPKPANIVTGCGTYDSPYEITSAEQFMTLYYYLTDAEKYASSLNNWKINAYGKDFSVTSDTVSTTLSSERTFVQKVYPTDVDKKDSDGLAFPTAQELSEAYYLIKEDIDLSSCIEFTGFGSSALPFTGVLIGKIQATENSEETRYPIITMPQFDTAMSEVGLIKYAKGAVVQNMTIVLPEWQKENAASYITITNEETSKGSAVMACILGGDNVISNVTVQGTIKSGGSKAKIGGYVGMLQMGSLILRNMSEISLNQYQITGTTGSFCGRVAGFVQDGFVVADDTGSAAVCTGNSTDANTAAENTQEVKSTLPLSRFKGIVSCGTLNNHKIVVRKTDAVITYQLDDAQDLLILSLALNSGAMSYEDNETKNDTEAELGYDELSKWRNADYNYVGDIQNAGFLSAYNDAIYYDNRKECKKTRSTYGDAVYHPYIYRYFDFGASNTSVDILQVKQEGNKSTLNAGGSRYALTASSYNMGASGIAECFYGIGARYYHTDGVYCMQGDLIGQGREAATITLAMNSLNGECLGFLNHLVLNQEQEISGFCLNGTVTNAASGEGKIAGLAADISGNKNLSITNVTTSGLSVQSVDGYVSAFIGCAKAPITFTGCESSGNTNLKITGNEDSCIGGFVANTEETNNIVSFKNCNINGLQINISSTAEKSNYLGGFVGKNQCPLSVNQGTDENTQIQNLTIISKQKTYCGGVIGSQYKNKQISLNHITLTNSSLTNVYAKHDKQVWIGGMVGELKSDFSGSILTVGSTNTSETVMIGCVPDSSNGAPLYHQESYVGGIIGYNNGGKITIADSTIQGMESSGNYTTQIVGSRYAGGLIGGEDDKRDNITIGVIQITNPTIKNIKIQASIDGANGAAGGIIGMAGLNTDSNNAIIIQNSVIENLNIIKETSSTDDTGNMIMGGMIGLLYRTAKVQDFQIQGLKIGTDGYCAKSGGIVGMMDTWPSCLKITASENQTNQIKNSIICGGIAGGIFGDQDWSTNITDISDVSIENTSVIAKYNESKTGASWTLYAGGIAGKVQFRGQQYKYKNMSLKNCVITGYQCSNQLGKVYLGGIIGARLENAYPEYYYNIQINNVLVGLMKHDANSRDVLPIYTSVTNQTDKLYLTQIDASNNYSQVELSEANKDTVAPENTIGIGMFAGCDKSWSHTYIIKAKVFYDDALECFRPAIDVGTTQLYDNMTTAYAAYRDNYHIIYSDDTDDDKDGVLDSLTDIEEIWQKCYENTTNKRNNDYRLDVSYGQKKDGTTDLSHEDVVNIYNTTYKDDSGYISNAQNAEGETIPMVVITSWDYTASSIINTYINILTNNGGASNSLKDILNTESWDINKKKVKITRKQLIEGESSNITDTNSTDAQQIFTYNFNSGIFGLTEGLYDTFTDAKNLTYTEIRVIYQFDENHTYTLVIPIHVKKLLKVDSHIQFLAGEHYNIADVSRPENQGASCSDKNTSVEHKSRYTLYSEFIYDSVRVDYQNATLEKSLCKNANEPTVDHYYDGTKITLIDITGGGIPYYYEVSGSATKVIPFEKFQDENGSFYQSKNMGGSQNIDYGKQESSYTDVCGNHYICSNETESFAVEQFLIIIDESAATEEYNTDYQLSIEVLRKDETNGVDNEVIYRNMIYDEGCKVKITEIPGLANALSGGTHQYAYQKKDNNGNLQAETFLCSEKLNQYFDGKLNQTTENQMQLDNTSKISEDGNIKVQGSLYIADFNSLSTDLPSYWNALRSSENEIYLEMALYITDGTNKIEIPKGTIVTYTEKRKSVAKNDTITTIPEKRYTYCADSGGQYIYYYNNVGRTGEEEPFLKLSGLQENTMIEFEMELDFSSADLSNIDTKSYQVEMQLLRTPYYQYPQSGEIVDEAHCGSVQGIAKKELGFALMPTENLTLGINGYQGGETDSGHIPFKTKIDFSDYIDSDKLSQYAGKYYTYTFVIKRKELQNDKGVYVTDSALQLENMDNSKVKILYQNSEASENAITICKTVQYTEAQITALREKGYVMEEDFILDASKLLSAENKYMTNYQVTCYVTITDSEPSQSKDQLIETSISNDFFIFTVAKLKTDMDYSH